jgi:hypothetical protein
MDVWIYLAGNVLTLVVTLGVVAYLQPHLRRILVDLCITDSRAAFWTVFSDLTLVLLPLLFTLGDRPDPRQHVVYALSDQLRAGLVGLVTALIGLGIVIGFFVLVARPAPDQPTARG